MSKQAQFKKIARQVRMELESFVGNHPNFNSQPHLGGLCGYGSVMLHEALKKAGYKSKIASGGGHWFVVCEGFLCDITASQFGQAKIVVRDYEKVKQGILSGNYQMNWWNAHSFHDTACGASLCNLKEPIKQAREHQRTKCVRCGDET